jgi:hypothetical protein
VPREGYHRAAILSCPSQYSTLGSCRVIRLMQHLPGSLQTLHSYVRRQWRTEKVASIEVGVSSRFSRPLHPFNDQFAQSHMSSRMQISWARIGCDFWIPIPETAEPVF